MAHISLNVKSQMDHLTKEQRHKNMAANKSKGTKLELLFENYFGMQELYTARMINL